MEKYLKRDFTVKDFLVFQLQCLPVQSFIYFISCKTLPLQVKCLEFTDKSMDVESQILLLLIKNHIQLEGSNLTCLGQSKLILAINQIAGKLKQTKFAKNTIELQQLYR